MKISKITCWEGRQASYLETALFGQWLEEDPWPDFQCLTRQLAYHRHLNPFRPNFVFDFDALLHPQNQQVQNLLRPFCRSVAYFRPQSQHTFDVEAVGGKGRKGIMIRLVSRLNTLSFQCVQKCFNVFCSSVWPENLWRKTAYTAIRRLEIDIIIIFYIVQKAVLPVIAWSLHQGVHCQ